MKRINNYTFINLYFFRFLRMITIDEFFVSFFNYDICLNKFYPKISFFELSDNLVVNDREEFNRLLPFISNISFINPSNRLILRRIPLSEIKINNPSIIVEFNDYHTISKLNVEDINVRGICFNQCIIQEIDLTVIYNNIIIEKSRLRGITFISHNLNIGINVIVNNCKFISY